MSSNNRIYGERLSGGEHGVVFTSPEVVRFMLDKVGYVANRDLCDITILEPSCGDGEFVIEIAKRLKQSSINFGFNAAKAFCRNVYAYDIDAFKIEECKRKLRELGFNSVDNIKVADFLKTEIEQVDIVVGNPPYIRYENIPSDMLDYCKSTFATFFYRSDLYVPFFEKSLSFLKKGGKHCFICSNRWLRNRYGEKIRQYIARRYNLQILVNMEYAKAFQEDVKAYPSITLISADTPSSTFEYADVGKVNDLKSLVTVTKSSPIDADWTAIFAGEYINDNLLSIEMQGFKIGVGVATGADDIFISEHLMNEVENELIIPAINARDLRGNNMQWGKRYLLNPYDQNGELISLNKFPQAECYLEKHRQRLSLRHIAKKSPTRWFRTIDRIDPILQHQYKILLPDMSGNNFIFVDEGLYYPMHNLYYITGNSNNELYVLAAMLMSDFVQKQLCAVSNKMNGGFPRWQSQYLRKLRLPIIKSMSSDDMQLLLKGYINRNVSVINNVVDRLINIAPLKHYRKEYVAMDINLQYC